MNTYYFRNMQELAHDLRQACLLDTGHELTARPWNFYDPENGTWYLLATTEWPAFPYPKLVVRKDERKGDLFLSLYVEKGFAPAAALVNQRFNDRGWIVQKSWFWHSYLKKIQTEDFLRATRQIISVFGEALTLKLSGTYTSGMEIFDDGEWTYTDEPERYYEDHSPGRLWFAL